MINLRFELNRVLTAKHKYMVVTVDSKGRPVYMELAPYDDWLIAYRFTSDLPTDRASVWSSKDEAEKMLTFAMRKLRQHTIDAAGTLKMCNGLVLDARSFHTLTIIRLETSCCTVAKRDRRKAKKDVLPDTDIF